MHRQNLRSMGGLMEWQDEYSVGILEIDRQHERLLDGFSIIEEIIALDQDISNRHYAIVTMRKGGKPGSC